MLREEVKKGLGTVEAMYLILGVYFLFGVYHLHFIVPNSFVLNIMGLMGVSVAFNKTHYSNLPRYIYSRKYAGGHIYLLATVPSNTCSRGNSITLALILVDFALP